MKGIIHHEFCYKRKPETRTSYYLTKVNIGLLPKRLCITQRAFTSTSGNFKQICGQLKATFTRSEQSIYKRGKGSVHSNIYAPLKPAKSIIGTGDIQGTRDLMIFQSLDEWDTIIIHLYPDGLFHEKELIEELMKMPLL